jgi:hypothetical protein
VKIVTEEKAGEKILDCWLAEKEGAFFLARGIAKNVRERSSEENEEQKGLIAKLKCQ